MLAALVCLRHWEMRREHRWIILASVCCLCAVCTDWPGYLFTFSVAVSFFVKKENRSRGFALALLGIMAASLILFLLQIRYVNPQAWRDLWTAVTMRFGNGLQIGSSAADAKAGPGFGFAEWVVRVLQSLDQNYLRIRLGVHRRRHDLSFSKPEVARLPLARMGGPPNGGGRNPVPGDPAELVLHPRFRQLLCNWLNRDRGRPRNGTDLAVARLPDHGEQLAANRRGRRRNLPRLPGLGRFHSGRCAAFTVYNSRRSRRKNRTTSSPTWAVISARIFRRTRPSFAISIRRTVPFPTTQNGTWSAISPASRNGIPRPRITALTWAESSGSTRRPPREFSPRCRPTKSIGSRSTESLLPFGGLDQRPLVKSKPWRLRGGPKISRSTIAVRKSCGVPSLNRPENRAAFC